MSANPGQVKLSVCVVICLVLAQFFVSLTFASTTEQIDPVCVLLAGSDGIVSLEELQAAIQYWQTQQVVPGSNGLLVSSPALMTLVGYWNTGERLGQTPSYTLRVTVVGSGAVAKNPDSATYAATTTVQLTAQPAAGWHFAGWSGALSGSNATASLTMDGNKAVTATFATGSPLPDTTVVMGNDLVDAFRSASTDFSTMVFAPSPAVSALSVGDTLIAGVTPVTPIGLLRRITQIEQTGSNIAFSTEPGLLAEAVPQGQISVSTTLTGADVQHVTMPSGTSSVLAPKATLEAAIQWASARYLLWDCDDNPWNDTGIWVGGSVTLTPSIDFGVDWDWFTPKSAWFVLGFEGKVDLQAHVQCNATLEFERDIMEITFLPIPTPIPFVVVVPVVTVSLGCSAEIHAGLEAGYQTTVSAKAGVRWNRDSGFTPVAEKEVTSEPFIHPILEFQGRFLYLKIRTKLLLDGITGPFASNTDYGEFNIGLLPPFAWDLSFGMDFGVGWEFSLLGFNLAEWEKDDLISIKLKIAEGQLAAPSGTLRGIVRDAVTSVPLSGVRVTVLSGGESVGETTTKSDGTYDCSVPAAQGYNVEFYKQGYHTEMYYQQDVAAGQTTVLETVLQVDETHGGTGGVAGTIHSALDNSGVAGLSLKLRTGINSRTGDVTATGTTESDGAYAFSGIAAGSYTVEAGGTGYNTTFFTVVCVGGTVTGNQDATVTPQLSPGEWRIVLTWGATPPDIDSHLTGPLANGTRFHMYYVHKGSPSPWPDDVMLDRDDVDSYGPETTTLLQTRAGVYRFSVHDYTNRSSSNSTALSMSGAQVRVYKGSGLLATYNVPQSEGGTLWNVFEIRDGVLFPINTMSYQSTPANVQSVIGNTGEPSGGVQKP